MSKKENGKKKSAQNSQKLLSGRRGIVLVALLAVMILVVNIVTMSYSWFSPKVKEGTGMTYTADLTVRSENCAIASNYRATVTNGAKQYDTTVSGSQTIAANSLVYFRTVIANNAVTPTNVSLYISQLPAPASASHPYGVGVAYPSNSYHKITAAQTDYYIIRNAYIAEKVGEEAGQLKIDWFIKTGSESVSIDFSKLYLMYN